MASNTLLRSCLRTQTGRHAIRSFSTTAQRPADWSHLQKELPARKIPLSYDYLSPTSSHLLNIALADVLPSFSSSEVSARIVPDTVSPLQLPPAHHLVHFPPAIPGKDLLSDGTDPLQSPGEPFIRRMWAGGSVRFNNCAAAQDLLALDSRRAVCLERIADVSIKGKEGDEKIFVGIERRIGRCAEQESEDSVRKRLLPPANAEGADAEAFREAGIIERRNIVFMRERSKEEAVQAMEKAKQKQMAPPSDSPDFSASLTPDAKLLFRYSALTYNAHAIHLDPEFCKEVEGHKGLVVHGPLSFTLMLTMLRAHLADKKIAQTVSNIEYRNLMPLYVDEKLRVCGKEKEEGKWDVWVETPEGGVAVKGTARLEPIKKGSSGRKIFGDLAHLGL